MASGNARQLSRDDWAAAALEALASGGLAAVKVEPLAKALGATKGSFYWHFGSRRELVEAALEAWEQHHTADVIARMDAEPDPRARLELLFRTIVSLAHTDLVELGLLTAADDPVVRPVVERVSQRRVGYVAELLEQRGFAPDMAASRARVIYATYLGHLQLARSTDLLPRPDQPGWPPYLDHLVEVVVRPPEGSRT